VKRFLPRTIVSRVIVVLFVALTASHLASMAFYYGDSQSEHELLGSGHVAERIATLAGLVNGLPKEYRPKIIAAASTPRLQLGGSERPPSPQSGRPSRRETQLGELIKSKLGGIGRRSIVVHLVRAGRDSSPSVIRASIGLDDGSWLNFQLSRPIEPYEFPIRLVLSTGLMGLAVLATGIWFARRFSVPLTAVARMAERLGADATIARLPERGPLEVQQMARAFNRMQERIQAFVADRTNLLVAITHDLRTPITRLKLRTEFIEDDEVREKTAADLDQMEKMISSVLSFAKGEYESEERSNLDLGALLQSVCADMSDIGRPAEFDGKGPVAFMGRPLALKRAFTNLIDNAVKYGACARVSLTGDQQHAIVRIEDDGPGIPEAEMDKVFEPFYRIDRGRNVDAGGTGLGLSLTRSIIRAHGGEIKFSNRHPKGLQVEVALPL